MIGVADQDWIERPDRPPPRGLQHGAGGRLARKWRGAAGTLLCLPWLLAVAPVESPPFQEWAFDADAPLIEHTAAIDLEAAKPLWLVVEIRSWNLSEADDGIVIAMIDQQEPDGGLAEIRFERTPEGEIVMRGLGHAGGTTVEVNRQFLNPSAGPLSIALEYSPRAHLYRIYILDAAEQWSVYGTGATRDERQARFLQVSVRGRSERGAPAVDVARIYLTPPASVAHLDEEPPFVTATAWAIADARTGAILAGHETDAPRKNASITKTMCALVVIRMAERDPSILDEVITFSQLAAGTRGSSARIAEGETLLVRDALYGLMLPSGNDAGNAIAEHFNDRLTPPHDRHSVPEALATRANFVAEMNRIAAELGMSNSIYRIPFGDGGSADDHTTTAADLMLLARAAFEDPLFREVVATQTYTATVTLPDGSTREATWTNTNRFLGREGFDGIKTGTTRTAGACLLSTAYRGDDRLFMVVLGSSYSNRRYIDSEALYDWAWASFFPATPAEQ